MKTAEPGLCICIIKMQDELGNVPGHLGQPIPLIFGCGPFRCVCLDECEVIQVFGLISVLFPAITQEILHGLY